MGIRQRLRRMVSASPQKPTRHRWLLDLTAYRAEQIYLPEFGQPHRMSIEAAPLSRLHAVVRTVDPRWAHTGVYAYPPQGDRTGWLHVTAGLSNPWHGAIPPRTPAQPERAWSGAGVELCMRMEERSAWAVDVLSAVMARQQCIAGGVLAGDRIALGDLIPIEPLTLPRGPTAPPGLTTLLAVRPSGMPSGFVLPYGRVDWIRLVGLTAAQATRAVSDPDGVLHELGLPS